METGSMSDTALLLTILVICLAGFAQGLTGFGFGLVAMPLLPLVMGLREAVALTVLLNIGVCAMTFFSLREHYSWRLGRDLVVGACLGVPTGVYALMQFNQEALLRILGAVMLFFSINELILTRLRPIRLPPRMGFPFGLISGGLSGAFNMGGPPAIVFTYGQIWSKEQIVAVLQVVFGLSTLLRLAFLGSAGLFSRQLFVISLWSAIPLIAAIFLGQQLFSRIPQPPLKRSVFLFLGLMGTKYLLFPN